MRNIFRMLKNDPEGKIKMLLDFTDRPGEVADPWYSGDFSTAYNDIYEGCKALIEKY
jgi:protein-tyrosine phosphatase